MSEVAATRTPWTPGGLLAAYAQAWRDVLGGEAPREALALLHAQATLECGHSGRSCWNHNVGNLMHFDARQGDWHRLNAAPECATPDRVPANAPVLSSTNIACAPGQVAYVPPGGSRFRAYGSFLEGCADKLRVLDARWPLAVVALRAGAADAVAFVAGLKGYFTADAAAYARNVRLLAAECLRTTPDVDWPDGKPSTIPPVDLPQPPNTTTLRTNAWGHAYRLTEIGPSDPMQVVRWLGVEKHARYQPTHAATFCNVYATDYCHAVGAYLPRVYWLPSALASMAAGQVAAPALGRTAYELSANALYRWLDERGESYGWERLASLDDIQSAANEGRAAIICGRRTNEAAPGHISVVAPESSWLEAMRVSGQVVLPVQSQAGGRNVELGHISAWWRGAEFAAYGFWAQRVRRVDTIPAPPPAFNDAPTNPETPTSKSTPSLRAVDAPVIDSPPPFTNAATPIRAGEGEREP